MTMVPANEAPMPPEVALEWSRFMLDEYARPPGRDLYDAIFDNGWLFPLQRRREMAAMMATARSIEPRVVMEIGTDKGGSFYHWVKALPTVKRAIGCEIRGVPWAASFLGAFVAVDFLALAESSYAPEAKAKVLNFLQGDPIDCLFLDGDKSNYHLDFALYAPLVRPGGIVFVHDIVDQWIEPAKFFYALADRYRLGVIIDGREGREAAMRAGPPVNAYDQWLRHWKWTSCGVGIVHV